MLAAHLARYGTTLALVLLVATPAAGAPKTDVLELVNGDRFTCEIKYLYRGQLTVKTDNVGTLTVKWDKVARIRSGRRFEVETTSGLRFLGSLDDAGAGHVLVVGLAAPIELALLDIVRIDVIGSSLWSQLNGHLDAGFTYTRASGVWQINLDHETQWRRPAFRSSFTFNTTITGQSDIRGSERSTLGLNYLRYRGRHWLIGGIGTFERNEEQGFKLRSGGAFVVGRVLTSTNRVESLAFGGLSVNEEVPLTGSTTTNVEALAGATFSYFTYDFPKTGIDVQVMAYPRLNETNRFRVNLNTAVRREIFRDFSVSLSVYTTYDSRPPTEDAIKTDVGVVTSIGWTF